MPYLLDTNHGTVAGIQRPNLEEWVMAAVFGPKVHPMILPFYKEIELEDGKRAAVAPDACL